MKLYQKLGLPEGSADPNFFLAGLNTILAAPDRDDTRDTNKLFLAKEYHALATTYYLQSNVREARRWAEYVAPAVEDYFFGDWRRTTPRAGKLGDLIWWKQQLSWMHEFEVGIAWGMCAGQWDRVRRLAEYPDDTCARTDAGAVAGSDPMARAALYMALAAFIRGDRQQSAHWVVQDTGDSTWYQPLADALSGLLESDSRRVSDGLTRALRQHRTRAKRPRRIDMVCDFDSTILFHLARQAGLAPTVAIDLLDYVVRLEE